MRRIIASMLGALAVAVAVGGCGSDEGEESAASRNPDPATAELINAIKAQVRSHQSVAFEFVMAASGQKVAGEGKGLYTDNAPTAVVVMTAGGQEFETRFAEESVFVRLPKKMSSMVKDDKTWIDVTKDKRAGEMLGGVVGLAESGNVVRMVEQFEQAGTVQESKQVTVGGKALTQYTVDIAVDGLKGELPYNLGRIQRQPGQTYSIALWVDKEGLPVKATTDLSELYNGAAGMAAPGGGKAKSTVTVTFSSWGSPVEVEAPAEDEIGTLAAQPGK